MVASAQPVTKKSQRQKARCQRSKRSHCTDFDTDDSNKRPCVPVIAVGATGGSVAAAVSESGVNEHGQTLHREIHNEKIDEDVTIVSSGHAALESRDGEAGRAMLHTVHLVLSATASAHYYQSLAQATSWLSNDDIRCGRAQARAAGALTAGHLPAAYLMPITCDDCVSGFRSMSLCYVSARALLLAADKACRPAVVIGDDAHWRCICISHERRTIYAVDSFGCGFPVVVQQAMELAAAQLEIPFTVVETTTVMQPDNDSYNCGVLAMVICELWESYIQNAGENRLCHLAKPTGAASRFDVDEPSCTRPCFWEMSVGTSFMSVRSS